MIKHPAFDVETNDQKVMLLALQQKPHIYAGTVAYGVIADRRAKGRAARKARRINRSR